jgi:hypothetical protein
MELVINIRLTDESKAGDFRHLKIKHCLHRSFEKAGDVLFWLKKLGSGRPS